MPRRRKSTTSKKGKDSTVIPAESKMESISSEGEPEQKVFKMNLKGKFDELIFKLESQLEYDLTELDVAYKTMSYSLPDTLLNFEITLEELFELIYNGKEYNDENDENNEQPSETNAGPTRKKRRRTKGLKYTVKKGHSVIRQSNKILETPTNKVSVAALTTAKKYTVCKTRKNVEESGISLKRVMRPCEEAISTAGSPLFVHPSASHVAAPVVNIPLPGGVIMNIEPKKTRTRLPVIPELDEHTKCQLQSLVEQLNSMI